MPNIPADPMILLSFVNTKLRDDYASLKDLCDSLGVSQEQITSKLAAIDYTYKEDLNRFV